MLTDSDRQASAEQPKKARHAGFDAFTRTLAIDIVIAVIAIQQRVANFASRLHAQHASNSTGQIRWLLAMKSDASLYK